MQFHSFINDEGNTDDAVEQIVDAAKEADHAIDAAFVFFTERHRDDADRIVERIWLELDPQCLIGCSAEGVIGELREIERQPGISLLVGSLPGVRLHPFRLAGQSAWREVIEDGDELRDRVGIGKETAAVIAFGDPFTTPLDQFMAALDSAAPGLPLIGGMASSGRSPGMNRLARNDEVFDEGLVGVSLSGPIEVATVVSQGCRPVGKPFVVTRGHDNVIEQLGGRAAMGVLRDVVGGLSEADQALLQQGLMIGRAISEYREQFGRGDFLVRNVIGVDEENGSIAAADYVKTGQTVQFHIRDATTADEDLRLMLEAQDAARPAAGGLLFSCNGRGTRIFPASGHDITTARRIMPATPMAGFFAAGELGPIGQKNFIHGHTASFALFRDRQTP
ncbi:MAG TPA: FIST N-terminal domain-containing protein [Tepidisphaeraceae bacterium]|nr:FIST N-terminal domain-containing protein [Tepidisphaeraceae bacterium]